MKAFGLVGLIVAFILASLWFITTQVQKNSQENIKKELIGKTTKVTNPFKNKKQQIKIKRTLKPGEPDYIGLTEKNNEIIKEQKDLLNKIKSKQKIKSFSEEKIIKEPSIIEELNSTKTRNENNFQKINNNGPITLKLKNWSLEGTNKNVLVASLELTNRSPTKEKKDIKIICSTFNEKGKFEGTQETNVYINLNSEENLELNSEIFGIVNTNSKSINCIIENRKEKVKTTSSKQTVSNNILNALKN